MESKLEVKGLRFIAQMTPGAQIMFMVALCIASLSLTALIFFFFVEPRIASQLKNRVDNLEKVDKKIINREIEFDKTITNNPSIAKSAPEIVDVANKHLKEAIAENEKTSVTSEPVFSAMNINELWKEGVRIESAKFGNYEEGVEIQVIYFLRGDNPIPIPKGGLEVVLSTMFVAFNYGISEIEKGSPFEQIIPDLNDEQQHLLKIINKYKYIKEKHENAIKEENEHSDKGEKK